MLYFTVTYVPAIVIVASLLSTVVVYPLVGIPSFVAFLFGLGWLQTVVLKLKPVKEKAADNKEP